jgi:DNA repair protein RadC
MGPSALSAAELIALVLGDGCDGQDAVALGHRVIEEFAGLARVASAFPEELVRCPGVGPADAARLIASFELASRATVSREGCLLDSGSAIAQVAGPLLARERREKVVVLVTDAANRVLRVVPVSTGALDSSPLPVREVLHAVLRYDGRAFALAHNHPSGDPTPSVQDRHSTGSLARAADAVGLRFLDHVVIGGTAWRSVR